MTRITNADLYGVLLEIKEDIGGLKKAAEVHLALLENHSDRLVKLEGVTQRQKGAAKVWGLVATAAATAAASLIEVFWHPRS